MLHHLLENKSNRKIVSQDTQLQKTHVIVVAVPVPSFYGQQKPNRIER